MRVRLTLLVSDVRVDDLEVMFSVWQPPRACDLVILGRLARMVPQNVWHLDDPVLAHQGPRAVTCAPVLARVGQAIRGTGPTRRDRASEVVYEPLDEHLLEVEHVPPDSVDARRPRLHVHSDDLG